MGILREEICWILQKGGKKLDKNTDRNNQKATETNAQDYSKQDITKEYDNFFFTELASLPNVLENWIGTHQNELTTVWDQSGMVFYVSKSVERLLGYPVSSFKGTYWYEQISPQDSSYIKGHIHDLTQEGKTFYIDVKDKQGNYIKCECHVAKLEHEGSYYYVSILHDISDKKELEEMMIRSEQMSITGELAASVVHEISNPLTSIKGFIQLLQAGMNRTEEYYKIMIGEIEKMETITSELLSISKPTTTHKQLESVTEMLQDVIKLLNPQARKKNITFATDFSYELFVYCNQSQIKQAFINLLKNAIEATDKDGKILVFPFKSDDDILIKIIDEGSGVPEEIIHKLGEPFFTTKQNGTGLGLMITKQILERHNGELHITKNKDKGSSFIVKLKT